MHHRALLLLCAQTSLASAQSPQTAEPRLATREEYAACLDQADEIEASRLTLARKQDELKELSAKFKAADDKFNAQVRQHAPSNKNEIQSYNRAVELRNRHVQEFNERNRALQREQAKHNARVVGHNTKCAVLAVPTEIRDLVAQERKNRGAKR